MNEHLSIRVAIPRARVIECVPMTQGCLMDKGLHWEGFWVKEIGILSNSVGWRLILKNNWELIHLTLAF